MRQLIRYAKAEGLKFLYGSVLCENINMMKMCRELGFTVGRDPNDEAVFEVKLDLASPAVSALLQSSS